VSSVYLVPIPLPSWLCPTKLVLIVVLDYTLLPWGCRLVLTVLSGTTPLPWVSRAVLNVALDPTLHLLEARNVFSVYPVLTLRH